MICLWVIKDLLYFSCSNGVPLRLKLNLSEFREAFISPTRQLLLLLSYRCEALLFPLITGSNHLESSSDERLQSQETEPHSSDSTRDDMPCTSGSVGDVDNDLFGGDSLRSKSYPFVGDVNSLAWGVCEDSYNQHNDALFRELLFVSGKHGVTVHAFVESTGNTAITSNALKGGCGQGRWVEWGPSASLVENMGVVEPTSLSSEATGNIDFNRAIGSSESPHICNVDGNDEFSERVASKRWLQSFLTKVENVECNGNILTRFPEKSLLPCSAKVVSFSLFNSNSPILDFLSNSDSASDKECCQETVHESESDKSMNLDITSSDPHFKSETLSNIFGVGMDSLYKCSRVFSSNSHYFVGFVFTQVDPAIVNASDESGRSKKNNVLLIARLDNSGIHWVSSTMSGEYVAHIDILQTLGLNPELHLQKQEALSTGCDKHIIQVDGIQNKSVSQHVDYSGRRVFKRLISASHTSLVGAIDDCGVIYVISASEYLPDIYYTNEKLLPHIQHLELGMLAGWEVGGSDIGHQREYSDIPGSWDSIIPSMRKGRSFLDDSGKLVLQRNQELYLKREGIGYSFCLSGFAASLRVTDQKFDDSHRKSHLMRKIFIPSHRFSDEDTTCFSPLGITRLMKSHSLHDQRDSQIVHLNLHAESAVCDDSFLNTGCKKFYLQGKEESFIGEAVGCTFQGCIYLVTEGGLSVVLPSISVSSNFLPVEVIGCQQLCVNAGIGYQVKDIRETKESKQPWSPWNVEIMDRVLLYESAEEADRLCLENGWDLKISRMRRLQLSLDYLKFDEIERSLEKLVGVNLAEEGVLRLLFAAVYLMLRKVGNDNEVSAASR
ncbi:hypothetical protein M0R45_005384 [Rubus argutus]|uniref:Uncharacterized protein n=1 Tax=Rubus argutus TaxID=59490 RepID=A0AAW1YMH7_RUBAR